jgi:hypothetical protein
MNDPHSRCARCGTGVRIAGALLSFTHALTGAAQATDSSSRQTCENCGVIVSIQMSTEQAAWTPLGAMTSGPSMVSGEPTEARSVFAFGSDGKRELVMIGAAGGAVYAKRPNSYQKPRWDVSVKMDSGGQRVIQQLYEPYLREGDRVRLLGTQLELVDS